jgi:hypothetical protein
VAAVAVAETTAMVLSALMVNVAVVVQIWQPWKRWVSTAETWLCGPQQQLFQCDVLLKFAQQAKW